jgi:hypothetical protein
MPLHSNPTTISLFSNRRPRSLSGDLEFSPPFLTFLGVLLTPNPD